MHRLIKPIFWGFLFLIMMLVIDQFLVQVPPVHPAHAAVTNFYRDFRGRLIDLAFNDRKAAPRSIEAVIEKQQKSPKPAPKQATKKVQEQSNPDGKRRAEKPQRYLYSDGKGQLHFADSLSEVPEEYRGLAQPMEK